MSTTPIIDALRELLPRATAADMAHLKEHNPFSNDAAMLVQFFAAMTWEMDTAGIAKMLGVSMAAADFVEAELLAAAVVPQADLRCDLTTGKK